MLSTGSRGIEGNRRVRDPKRTRRDNEKNDARKKARVSGSSSTQTRDVWGAIRVRCQRRRSLKGNRPPSLLNGQQRRLHRDLRQQGERENGLGPESVRPSSQLPKMGMGLDGT